MYELALFLSGFFSIVSLAALSSVSTVSVGETALLAYGIFAFGVVLGICIQKTIPSL